MSIKPLNHYALENSASIHDEEALTALQLAGRTAGKVNQLVEAFNELDENVAEHLENQDAIIDKAVTYTIPQTVKARVQEHIDEGDFDAAIDNYMGELEARVDNLLTHVPAGGTSMDAEVVDLRVGANSFIHANAGSAVRDQFRRISNTTAGVKINNFLNVADYMPGQYIDTNYNAVENSAYDTYCMTLESGTYFANVPLRFVVVPEQGEYMNGDADCRPFVVDQLSKVYVTFFKESKGVRKLYRYEDTALWEVEDEGAKRLDESVDLPHPYKMIKNGIFANNLLNTAECFPGFMNLIGGNMNMESDAYVCYRLWLTPGVYTVGPRARYITNMTDGTERGTQQNPVEVDYLVIEVDGDKPKLFYVTMYTTDADRYLVRTQDWTVGMVSVDNDLIEPADVVRISAKFQPEGNYLAGRLWAVCGDSFSVQGYTGSEADEASYYTYQDGPYKGKQITYPYIIGLRNGMNVENMAVSGLSLRDYVQSGDYIDIPDADYITLYFGINDYNQNVPVGTINDETDATFYGCWNELMRHLLTKFPYAKIGVVISNGTAKQYTDAELAICRKWGIPYLDMVNDPTVPLMHRVDREGVCAEAKQLRLQAFRVNTSNTHPNRRAQEYESTFIEHWLRSL